MSTPHMLLPITHMVEVPGWVGVTVTVVRAFDADRPAA